jgi:hypothetical protein
VPGEERFGEPAVGGLHARNAGEQGAQAAPGVRIGQRVIEKCGAVLELLGEGGSHQGFPGGDRR